VDLWCLDYKSLVASPLVICNLGTTRVENCPHLWCLDYKSFVDLPLMICNLGTTRVENSLPLPSSTEITHYYCRLPRHTQGLLVCPVIARLPRQCTRPTVVHLWNLKRTNLFPPRSIESNIKFVLYDPSFSGTKCF
jgi:hypothetical protein